jgi:hypothetical protein
LCQAARSVAPVVDNAAAPIVDNVVTSVAAVVDNAIAPVVDNAVAPVVDNAVSPVVDNAVAPVVDNAVAPVADNAIAPVVDDVAEGTGHGLGASDAGNFNNSIGPNNQSALPSVKKGELEKFRQEELTADFLRQQGRTVTQNPTEALGRGNAGGDRLVDGVRTEFKRFRTADPDKLLRKIEKSISGGGQAPNLVLDLRGQGATIDSAQEVIRRLPGRRNANRLDSIEIIGDNFSIRSRVRPR